MGGKGGMGARESVSVQSDAATLKTSLEIFRQPPADGSPLSARLSEVEAGGGRVRLHANEASELSLFQ